MCGRHTLRTKLNLLLHQFAAELAEAFDYDTRHNIAPTQNVLAVRLENSKRRTCKLRWRVIPSWDKVAKISYTTINARADTIATKPAFRSANKSRRCLVVADGCYEWLREGKDKQPFVYEVDSGKPFAFAGLWEAWRGPSGTEPPLESCTVIITDDNELALNVRRNNECRQSFLAA